MAGWSQAGCRHATVMQVASSASGCDIAHQHNHAFHALQLATFGMTDMLFRYVSILGFESHDRHEPSSAMSLWPQQCLPSTVLGHGRVQLIRQPFVQVGTVPIRFTKRVTYQSQPVLCVHTCVCDSCVLHIRHHVCSVCRRSCLLALLAVAVAATNQLVQCSVNAAAGQCELFCHRKCSAVTIRLPVSEVSSLHLACRLQPGERSGVAVLTLCLYGSRQRVRLFLLAVHCCFSLKSLHSFSHVSRLGRWSRSAPPLTSLSLSLGVGVALLLLSRLLVAGMSLLHSFSLSAHRRHGRGSFMADVFTALVEIIGKVPQSQDWNENRLTPNRLNSSLMGCGLYSK
eukprot:3500570-Rhodomonas_salina.2